jgi:hypothetical protein
LPVLKCFNWQERKRRRTFTTGKVWKVEALSQFEVLFRHKTFANWTKEGEKVRRQKAIKREQKED